MLKGGKEMKAKCLQPGDTIGIIAPASPTDPVELEMSLEILAGFGYRVKPGRSLGERYGYLAGRDEIRAEDINRMFADPEVDAVFCLRGGYGTPRLLDLIDYEIIRANPKIFAGYSDITALHVAIYQRTGLVTFHGPMVFELAKRFDALSWHTLFTHLSRPCPVGGYLSSAESCPFTIVQGEAEGKLVGGNLSLLAALLGTPYEVDTRGHILFIEEIEEEPYRIDRMLTQLRLAGKLQQASGIVITECTDCEAADDAKSLTVRQVLEDILKPLGIPAFYGLKAGHTNVNLTLPVGVRAKMDAGGRWLQFQEAGVTC
ncbi:LD-carboxypeptidase [Thermoactinomyces sp. CICC 10521]|nr:LD-carboxypeptidase [Thermoactinomyces sp. CICC 10521]